jgi:quercetin dioxygenase-like cupin family protein
MKTHAHPGIEFLMVLAGSLGLRVGDEDYELKKGDAIYFDSSVAHAYRRVGAKPTSALVVTTA